MTGTLQINAVNYDSGGEGISYNDSIPGDDGGTYRPGDDVNIIAGTDTGGGYEIASTANGDWFEYTILVQEPGYYNLALRYANATSGATVNVTSELVDLTGGPLTLPTTGGLSTWSTFTTPIFLGEGQQVLRISMPVGGYDLNWLELTPIASGPVANGTCLVVNRNSGQAMQFSTTSNDVVQEPPVAGSTVQDWNLQSLGAGEFEITSAYNGDTWNADGNTGHALGTSGGWSLTGSEEFMLHATGDGYYNITTVNEGYNLDIASGSTTAGANVEQDLAAAGPNQEWAVTLLPAAPTHVEVVFSPSPTLAATVLWTNNATTDTAYEVDRSSNGGTTWTTLTNTLPANSTSYTDMTVTSGQAYEYQVEALAGSVPSTSVQTLSETASALPSPYSHGDVGDAATLGAAGSASYNSSTGTYTITGSGADIWNAADAFQFAYETMTGNATLIARVTGQQDTNTWAKAGLMFRNSTAAGDMEASIVVSYSSGVSFQWRSSVGGSSSNTGTSSSIVAPAWVELVRSGNSFSAYYSTSTGTPTTWTQVGSAETIAMLTSALAGLCVTSHDTGALNAATFTNVSATGTPAQPPTVATAAAASPSTVTGTTTAVSVLGADSAGAASLLYYWATSGSPPGAVVFSNNGTNAAQSTTATFSAAGSYTFVVGILDPYGLSTTSTVSVTVVQTPTSVRVSPGSTTVPAAGQAQFTGTLRRPVRQRDRERGIGRLVGFFRCGDGRFLRPVFRPIHGRDCDRASPRSVRSPGRLRSR